LARVGARLGTLVLTVLAWHLFSAHAAAVNIRAAAKPQAVVVVAVVTKPQLLSDFVELVLPGNEKPNYDAPIYTCTSGYLKCWLVGIGTTNAMTPLSRTI
jgi:hypothetical protein